jgi:hypothetical protein
MGPYQNFHHGLSPGLRTGQGSTGPWIRIRFTFALHPGHAGKRTSKRDRQQGASLACFRFGTLDVPKAGSSKPSRF